MTKKTLYLLGGILTILLFLAIGFFNIAQAAEGECHLKHCLVPAPTVIGPGQGSIVDTQRPGIKGLTWKTTVVKVYIDGVEQQNVTQIKHEDYYGSFYVEPDYNLTPGIHYAYTIAHSENPGWYDQSKESTYIYFTVESPPPPPQPPISTTYLPPAPPAEPEPEPDKIQVSDQEPTAGQVDIVEPDQAQPNVNVEQGQIEGGVYVEEGGLEDVLPSEDIQEETEADELGLQDAAEMPDLSEILQGQFVDKEQIEKTKRNRTIGLSILALIVVFSVIWLVADKKKIKSQSDKDQEGDLPPPPAPPADKKKKQKAGRPSREGPASDLSQEISPPPIEPAKAKEEDLNRYFASPPPSPNSPYPPKSEDVEYVPLDKDSQFNAEEALRDLEERFIPDDDQDKLI